MSTVRGILYGLALSAVMWGLFVALPLYLHYGRGWGK